MKKMGDWERAARLDEQLRLEDPIAYAIWQLYLAVILDRVRRGVGATKKPRRARRRTKK